VSSMSNFPDKWDVKSLGEACKTIKGKKPKNTGPASSERTVPYINIKAFESGRPQEFAAPGDYPICERDDVLIVWDGARAGLSGRAVPGYVGSTLAKVYSDAADNRYLFYFLQSQYGRINSRTKGVGIPHVDPTIFNNIPFPIAPLAQQRHIVAEIEKQFSRLDEAVANIKRVDANLKRYKAAVLKAALEGRLVETETDLARREGRSYETGAQLLVRILEARASQSQANARHKKPVQVDISNPKTLPEGWVWTSVDCVGDVLLGRQRAPQYLTGRYSRPYLRVANVKDSWIDFSDLEEMDFDEKHFPKYRLESGDILISEGQSPELLGQSAIFKGFPKPLCFQKTLHRFRPIPGSVSPDFAQIVFRSHVQTGVFRKLGSITTNIAHLTLEKFRAAPFPLPPLAEQHRIVMEVERVLAVQKDLATEVHAHLKRTNRIRQCLLQRAFSLTPSSGLRLRGDNK